MRGFSLPELVVALAVAGTLIAIAVPSITSRLADRRIGSARVDLMWDIRRARRESDVRRTLAVICPLGDGPSCADDWDAGWLVFLDSVGGTPASLDASDTLLSVRPLPETAGLDIGVRSRGRWSGTTLPTTALRFAGRTRGATSSIVVCDRRGEESIRSLSISASGAVSDDPGRDSSGASVDLWGGRLACPG